VDLPRRHFLPPGGNQISHHVLFAHNLSPNDSTQFVGGFQRVAPFYKRTSCFMALARMQVAALRACHQCKSQGLLDIGQYHRCTEARWSVVSLGSMGQFNQSDPIGKPSFLASWIA
jgi:hypothetical protein